MQTPTRIIIGKFQRIFSSAVRSLLVERREEKTAKLFDVFESFHFFRSRALFANAIAGVNRPLLLSSPELNCEPSAEIV